MSHVFQQFNRERLCITSSTLSAQLKPRLCEFNFTLVHTHDTESSGCGALLNVNNVCIESLCCRCVLFIATMPLIGNLKKKSNPEISWHDITNTHYLSQQDEVERIFGVHDRKSACHPPRVYDASRS